MVPWTYIINYFNGEEIDGVFYERELQKKIQKECRKNKVIKRNGDKLYVKWEGCDNFLIAGLIKNTLYKMIQYFPKQYELFGGDININGDLSNYTHTHTHTHTKQI